MNTMFSATSSSSSSSPPKQYYDVFLSFRGSDTRNNLTGHLHEALKQRGFHTFFDVDKLERGEFINEGLMKAIEDSNCWIVVLSENYASSNWCLIELARIVECVGTSRQVLPIFYNVNADDLRNLSGSYEETMKDHENDHDSETVQSWRDALKTVGNIAGWNVIKDKTDESKFIKEFITQISRKPEFVRRNINSLDLFGINPRLEKFESTISPSSDTAQFIGICGMGGIGKTTLVSAYYNQNFYKFEAYSFLANVRETYERRENGLVYLQTQLLSNILNDKDVKIDNVVGGKDMIRTRLQHKKVLIVLDNVNILAQLEALAGQEDWFGRGSIIIVTTRDQGVLTANRINATYQAEILNSSEALQLFSRKAFNTENPPEDYEEVSEHVITYANGLPLALTVLGSFFSGKTSKNDFEIALNRLREYQIKEISPVLRISFDDLEEIDQKIFLDIACFFKGYDKDHVKEILNSCGISECRISNLIEKSLLSIDQHDKLHMHDLLQEMGKNIVKNQSPDEPGRRSRIWDVDDFYHILENKTGTDEVEAIVTSVQGSKKKLTSFEAISQMKNLRMLMIFYPDEVLCGNDNLIPDLEYLSNELRLFHWDTFPYKGFPSSFRPYRLVKLKLFDSSIEKLWNKDVTPLRNLTIIDLSNSWNLTKFEDFMVVPNLERLILEGIKLLEIHDSITRLEKLVLLDLAFCTSLKKLPKNIKGMTSLQILNLYDCSELWELPEDCGDLKSLKEVNVRESGINHLPSSIFLIENLEVICDEEVAKSSVRESIINPPIGHCFLPDNLRILTKLDLSNCNLKDEAFPEHFGYLVSLEELDLSRNSFSVLPPRIKGLTKLTYLNLMCCKSLTHLSPDQLPSSLETLRVDYCTSLITLLDPSEPCHLQCSTYCVDCTELVKKRGGEKTALASLKRYIQNPTHPTRPRPFDVVIPGSEIPAWFTSRSSGPSITIKLDGNNKWMGIAFSVCFRANSSNGDDKFSCTVRVRGENKKLKLVTEKIYKRSSNHFWLCYSPRGFYIDCLQNNYYGLQFSFYANKKSKKSCCGPCGVRLVYEEDIAELNQIISQYGNESHNQEADHCSHSKSLKACICLAYAICECNDSELHGKKFKNCFFCNFK